MSSRITDKNALEIKSERSFALQAAMKVRHNKTHIAALESEFAGIKVSARAVLCSSAFVIFPSFLERAVSLRTKL